MAKPHLKLKVGNQAVNFKPQDLSVHIAVAKQFSNGFNGWLPNPDPILKKAGKQIYAYRELLRDPLVGSLVRRRKAVVAKLEWKLEGDDVADHVFEALEKWLQTIDIYSLVKDILNSAFFGYQPIELIWRSDSLWLPDQIIAKPQEWFSFNQNGELLFTENGINAEPVPAYKFLCPTQEATYNNPYGYGDLGLVFWLTTFKRGGLKFWVEFTEKYGAPWVIGKEPRANQHADTEKLLDALEALVGNSVGTIPNDSSVEIHEASGKSSSVDAYDKLIRYCRSEISIALLGQDQTTEANTNHASATAGLEVTDDIRDSDSRIVESAFNQMIKWVVELNFGDVPAPKFVLFENEESGTKERAERDKLLSEAGAVLTNQYWQRVYGLEDGDLAEPQPNVTPSSHLPEFSESEPAADAGLIIDHLAPDAATLNSQAQALTEKLVQNLKAGVKENKIMDMLIAQYPEMDDTALQNELARLLFLSGLVGRIEAAEEMA